jgi:outer membrane immunogenic protein
VKKFAFAAAAIAAAVATPALAQDGKTTTIYAGPIIGYDHVSLSDGVESAGDDGVMYGVSVGADFAMSKSESMFVGIEGEFSDSNTGESADDVLIPGDRVTIGAGRNFYVGGRIGMGVGGAAKVYLKGGYSNARVDGSYNDTVDTYHISDDLDGWVVGAGVEAKLSPVLLRLEYRYSKYGDIKVEGVDTGIDASRHQVVAGALFAF